MKLAVGWPPAVIDAVRRWEDGTTCPPSDLVIAAQAYLAGRQKTFGSNRREQEPAGA
jgi:hypothetical protein